MEFLTNFIKRYFLLIWDSTETKPSDSPETQAIDEKKILRKDRTIIIILWGLFIIFIGSICLLLVEGFLSKDPIYIYTGVSALFGFIRDIGIALFSAGIIGLLIEIQDVIDFAEKTLLSVLTSKAYLSTLEKDKLEEIKTSCSELILKSHGNRKENNLNESLLILENAISALITEPYYEFMNQYITCELVDLQKTPELNLTVSTPMIKKTTRINFKLVSPKDGPDKETIRLKANMFLTDGIKKEDEDKILYITKFTYQSDSQPEVNLSGKVNFRENTQEVSQNLNQKYNRAFQIKMENGDPIVIDYQNELFVQIDEVRHLPISDDFHSFKMTRPCKSLTIQYFCQIPNMTLKCEYFGTLPSKRAQELTINESAQMVTVESRKWLLPGNGLLIGHIANETPMP